MMAKIKGRFGAPFSFHEVLTDTMSSKHIVATAATTMRAVCQLQDALFLSGLLTTNRARQLRITKAALEMALDFLPDAHRLRLEAEEAVLTDTGVIRALEASAIKKAP